MKKWITLLSVILVLCVAVCGLTACGDDEKKDDTKKETVSTAEGVKVSLTADGKTSDLTTSAKTVKELLDEQKITLGKDDEVSPKLEDAVTDGMKIVIKRVEIKEETKTEAVKFESEEVEDSSMAEGTSEVTQKGVNGEKQIVYKVKIVDGKEESREKVSEKVTKEPVKQITSVGTASSGGNDTGNDTGNDDGSDDGGDDEVYEVDRQDMPNCDGSGHGYYLITYSDGSVGYELY